jgi:anti-sigma factor RsiW
MNCDELLKTLNDFVEGDIDPSMCRDFEHHLAGCNPCQVVVDNIRKTITLFKAGEPYPMPEEFHRRLHDTLRERWRKKFGK